MIVLSLLASSILLLANVSPTSHTALPGKVDPAKDEQHWRFQVYVNDKPVGLHEFRLQQQGDQLLLSSAADFKYKLMFVTVYNYQHRNQEIWQDGCLARIDSSTDANGKDYAVTGEKGNDGFTVQGKQGNEVLPECVMSFAYWNPAFLQVSRLLNTQNGEYLEVTVSEPASDIVTIQGEEIPAQRYQLSAKKLELALWYSEQGAWLGLESIYEGGRTLRYELLSPPTSFQREPAEL